MNIYDTANDLKRRYPDLLVTAVTNKILHFHDGTRRWFANGSDVVIPKGSAPTYEEWRGSHRAMKAIDLSKHAQTVARSLCLTTGGW